MNRLTPLIDRGWSLYEHSTAYYESLNPRAKLLLWIWIALHIVGMIAFWWIGWENIFAWMAQLADNVRELRYGWLILSGIVVVTSLPPLIGYGTAQTLIGFAFGVMPGFFISAGSCLVGGVFAFVVVRKLVRFFAPFIHKDKTFQALSNAVRVKGLPLIVLLRLCPFPYPYSNAFFASVESVTLGQFFLATLTITPKLLLHVFIGHRTYLFADPTSRHRMDPFSRYLNLGFMLFGTLLGMGTSWYLYKTTMRFVEEAERERIELGEEGGDEEEGEGDLETGLLGRVDELLDEEDEGGKDRRDGRLVDVQEEEEEEDDWNRAGAKRNGEEEDFSDFSDHADRNNHKPTHGTPEGALLDLEDEETASRGANANRRDSEAWGLDFDAEEEDAQELPQVVDRPVKKRID
ncbi:uncharacterized protein JCM6883_004297 [Sporobolomyces salmoneus]|uniref:uncharacterized protein n=1 Tax=Sporobolomyces salmoneus TaxID=183962 RepID=UPI00316B2EF4